MLCGCITGALITQVACLPVSWEHHHDFSQSRMLMVPCFWLILACMRKMCATKLTEEKIPHDRAHQGPVMHLTTRKVCVGNTTNCVSREVGKGVSVQLVNVLDQEVQRSKKRRCDWLTLMKITLPCSTSTTNRVCCYI